MTQEEFLAELAGRLEAAGIPYMVAGSHASSYHGQPRATQDVDLVIDPSPEQLDEFLTRLGDPFYVSPEAAHEALRRRSPFNIILVTDGWKADLIIRKERPFSLEEFRRRQVGQMHGRALPLASAEDVILSKLEWSRISQSERQLSDALNVAVALWPALDRDYLRKWASELGVANTLDELLRQGERLIHGPQQ
jgi:hypothetical protein